MFKTLKTQMEKCTFYERRFYLQALISVKRITLEVITIDQVGYPLV